MMHSKDLQKPQRNIYTKCMHCTALAHNFDLQCRYTNNEGSNANEHLFPCSSNQSAVAIHISHILSYFLFHSFSSLFRVRQHFEISTEYADLLHLSAILLDNFCVWTSEIDENSFNQPERFLGSWSPINLLLQLKITASL